MCSFGGSALDVLYVTSAAAMLPESERGAQPLAGALFAIHGLGATGLPEPFFACLRPQLPASRSGSESVASCALK